MALSEKDLYELCYWAQLPVSLHKGDVLLRIIDRVELGSITPEQIQRAYDVDGVDGVEQLFK